MSRVKRILAFVVAMAMVVAMSVTAFAAPTGNVTVGNVPEGATVTYKQIIVEDRTSDLGWKFASDDIATAFVNAYKGNTNMSAYDVIADMISAKMLENPMNANVTAGTVNSSAALGKALAAVQGMATDTTSNNAFTPSTIGLYVIKVVKEGYTFIPMSAYVGTTFNGLTVQVKGSEDQVRKAISEDGQSVSEGDVVTYTVTAQYPYYSADAVDKKFIITDTVENATINNNNVTVKIDNNTVSSGYTNTFSEDSKVMTLNFTYDARYAGKTVEISYNVTVGEVSPTVLLKNTVKSEIATGATEYVVKSDTVAFEVTKTDDAEKDPKPLSGAEFTVYVEADQSTEGRVELKYKESEEAAEQIIYAKEVKTMTTDAKGKAVFDGLDAQKVYYVTETKAPEGYSLNTTVYKLTRDATNDKVETETKTDETTKIKTITTEYSYTDFTGQTVTDTKLSALPSTGGVGITIFTIVGCVIMSAAAAMFFISRRKSEE